MLFNGHRGTNPTDPVSQAPTPRAGALGYVISAALVAVLQGYVWLPGAPLGYDAVPPPSSSPFMKEFCVTEGQSPTTGTISWIDLANTDLDRAKPFYTSLFGWEAFVIPDIDAGGYGFFLKDGKQVAGFGPTMGDEGFSAWNTYVSVDDADATVERVKSAGGQVIAGPMDVFNQGRLTVFNDPSGAFFSTWQPREMQGLQVRDEPGALCWVELNTRDAPGAEKFYTSVFGWGAETEESDAGTYTQWTLNGKSIGGMFPMNEQIPADVPPHWRIYLMVEDVDATVARAQELGGSVMVPAMDIPGTGRFAVLSDPAGAAFAVMRFAQ